MNIMQLLGLQDFTPQGGQSFRSDQFVGQPPPFAQQQQGQQAGGLGSLIGALQQNLQLNALRNPDPSVLQSPSRPQFNFDNAQLPQMLLPPGFGGGIGFGSGLRLG